MDSMRSWLIAYLLLMPTRRVSGWMDLYSTYQSATLPACPSDSTAQYRHTVRSLLECLIILRREYSPMYSFGYRGNTRWKNCLITRTYYLQACNGSDYIFYSPPIPPNMLVSTGKPTTASSQYGSPSDYGPQMAVDGLTSTFFHSSRESNPWWKVDLLLAYVVGRVKFYNREGIGGERTQNVQIKVAETEAGLDTDESLCYYYDGPMVGGQIVDMTCYQPIFGQFVKATMLAGNYFNFNLIEVFTAA